MTAKSPIRLFDVQTADRLSTLHAFALEHGQRVNIDFDGYRVPSAWWIIQLFDHEERDIISARGKTLAEAVADLHERWLAKGLPG